MSNTADSFIWEEKVELAKRAIARGKHSLADIAEDFELPMGFVEELACLMDDEISEKTLAMMDEAVKNLKAGIVSDPVELTEE